jgi:hypothetical protein
MRFDFLCYLRVLRTYENHFLWLPTMTYVPNAIPTGTYISGTNLHTYHASRGSVALQRFQPFS